jgi:hypothetical protein
MDRHLELLLGIIGIVFPQYDSSCIRSCCRVLNCCRVTTAASCSLGYALHHHPPTVGRRSCVGTCEVVKEFGLTPRKTLVFIIYRLSLTFTHLWQGIIFVSQWRGVLSEKIGEDKRARQRV